MGVSGCGKTSIGMRIAGILNFTFYEGDDFHSAANVKKMAGGTPLTDEDRESWLGDLSELIKRELSLDQSGVLTCSALKEDYRQRLQVDSKKVVFIYLKGGYDLIYSRMAKRKNHYMTPKMLKSQFKVLEEPVDVFTVNIENSPEEIVEEILTFLKDREK